MLYKGGGSKGGSSHSDSFGTSVIDTIVAEVQGVPGEDRCVLMLGYEAEMQDMFNVRCNPHSHIRQVTGYIAERESGSSASIPH